jgi:hypothetical protein
MKRRREKYGNAKEMKKRERKERKGKKMRI